MKIPSFKPLTKKDRHSLITDLIRPMWYEGWSITTDYLDRDWVRKTIRLPNSHTAKIRMMMVKRGTPLHNAVLLAESALFQLSEYERDI